MKNRVRSKLAEIRGSRGIAAAAIAKRVGVTRQTIYAIEAGNYVPNTEVALRLARELEVSVEELFTLAQSETPGAVSMPAEYLSPSKANKGQAVRLGQVGTKWVSVPVSASSISSRPTGGQLSSIGSSRVNAMVSCRRWVTLSAFSYPLLKKSETRNTIARFF